MHRVSTLRSRLSGTDPSHSYGLVLVMVLAVVFVTIAMPDDDLGRLLLVVVGAATLVVAVWTTSARAGRRRAVLILAVAAVLAAAVASVVPGETTEVVRFISLALVAGLPLILGRGVAEAIRTRGVTLNAVAGVLTLYLLLALVFSLIYLLCNDLGDAPFFAGKPKDVFSGDFVYFAVTTQTTVGFGDFVPGTDVGRALSASQAVIGQMYLVTVVAVVISNLGRGPRTSEPPAGDEA